MKIEKEGWKSSNWSATFQCHNCGTILHVFRHDLRQVKLDAFVGGHYEVRCNCMCCNAVIVIHRDASKWDAIPETTD